jgi:hypothetical protein
MPADYEADAATATRWSIDVNDANNELVADDVYVLTLILAIVNPYNPAGDPVTKMVTIIFAA